ncbi:hypothetical protein AAHA92_15666 [Salvia divinorum]|uniref:Uncharacterized protein n=1 Tax=Salvia divinorum TaxID=28513 RepID=A0ABD1HFG6_SALDI
MYEDMNLREYYIVIGRATPPVAAGQPRCSSSHADGQPRCSSSHADGQPRCTSSHAAGQQHQAQPVADHHRLQRVAAQPPNSPVVAASRPSLLLLSDSAFSSTRRRFQPCRRTALVAVEQHQAQPGPAPFSATPPTASAAPADDLLCHCSAPYVDADAIAAMPCSVARCSTSTTGAYFGN